MADDSEPKTGRPRFLSRAKWGKVFKEQDSANQPAPTFQPNSDVDDFLKPSRDAVAEKIASVKPHLAPKLDIAIAKRWPDTTGHIRLADAPSPPPAQTFFRKPPRRPGLTVSFSKAEPEIIGEGGDDALDPAAEISRRKSMFARSISEKRPNALEDGTPWPGTHAPRSRSNTQTDSETEVSVEDPRRFVLKRAETSFGETSRPLQIKHTSPPLRGTAAGRPLFGRGIFHASQTGSGSEAEQSDGSLHPSSSEASLVVKKQRDMRASEGMAFRRASALISGDEEEDPRDKIDSAYAQTLGVPQHAPEPPRPANLENFPPLSPDTPVDPSSNPFADPKYVKRHSVQNRPPMYPPPIPRTNPDIAAAAEAATLAATTAAAAATSLSQPEHSRPSPVPYQPSYMQAQQPPQNVLPVRETSRAPPAHAVPNAPAPSYSAPIAPPPLTQAPTLPQVDLPMESLQHHRQLSANKIPHDSRDEFVHSPMGTHHAPSNTSLDRLSAGRPSYSSTTSRDADITLRQDPTHASLSTQGSHDSAPSNMLGISPAAYARVPSKSPSYFAVSGSQQASALSPQAAVLKHDNGARPNSTEQAQLRLLPSSPTQAYDNSAAEASLTDFSARVEHKKGVFSLTAEKERPADHCRPDEWSRNGLWWALKAKAGLEIMVSSRRQSSDPGRELLAQPHVDLAKALWILNQPLQTYADDAHLVECITALRHQVRALTAAMAREHLMPPKQSLIQGQDTSIWLQYPRFTPEAIAALSGSSTRPITINESLNTLTPLEALPLADTSSLLCYGRIAVDVSIGTEDSQSDRISLPCNLSMVRASNNFQIGVVIASQSDLVNVKVGPKDASSSGLTWHEVSWKASAATLVIHLPFGYEMTARMTERDFRSLWNLVEYSRKVEYSLRPAPGEIHCQTVRLSEAQYADPTNGRTFPNEKLSNCSLMVFEKKVEENTPAGMRKMHRGFRLTLVTDQTRKTLSSVSRDIGRQEPLLFEYLTDTATSKGARAMVIRLREEKQQFRMLLVFPDARTRQSLYDLLIGMSLRRDETIVISAALAKLNIQPASQGATFPPQVHPALQDLQWAKLYTNNLRADDGESRFADTVESEGLRVVARHMTGCVTDRMNLSKGELLVRLPCIGVPAIQILRQPQADLSMAIDSRYTPPPTMDGLYELLHLAQQARTVRTLTFASHEDLHAFQFGITGYTVAYDGLASAFSISRRMMVVSIHHKWQASNVRIQVLQQAGVTQVVAFMEDFSHTDAMCFRVKSTDTFEKVKGGKDKKWAIKMKEAKFSLPPQDKNEVDQEERIRRRFVNLEGLDYAEEHDDITIGFETEEERDKFAQALPAETTVGRMITLKRRI